METRINGNKAEKDGSDPAGEQDRKSSEGGGKRERGKENGAMKAVDTDSKGEKRQQTYCNSTLALQFLAHADCGPPMTQSRLITPPLQQV